METKNLFKKYRSRLICEGILKSFLIGLIVAFAIDAPIALITSAHYFTDAFEFWYLVALGIGLAVGLIVAIIFYFMMFRPTTKKIARRVDMLGLDERIITMLELEKDESYLAMRQREDALEKIKTVNSKSIRFIVAKPLIVAAVVVGVVGMLMTTVNVLATYNVVEPPPFIETREQVNVEYKLLSEVGGKIEGNDLVFKIYKGEDTLSPVCAVADDGYEFECWLDEMGNIIGEYPERQEFNVKKDMVIYAMFKQLDITDVEDPKQATDPYAYPKPDQIGDDPKPDPDNNQKEETNMTWSPNNQIKDNNTSYYGEYGPEKEDAMIEIENDATISSKHKEVIGSYYDQLTPPDEKDNPQ